MTTKLLNRALTGIAVTASFTIAAALPITASAVTTTGYEDWGDTAGVVLWRAVSGTETLFHSSTVIDVASDGTLGTAYAMDAGNGTTSWKKFASNQTGIYSAPGRVLVYDAAGYTASSDAQFAPLSFGGMWVKALQAEGVPYCITDNKTDGTDRKVELGASGYSTLFKFDKSFTFDRNSAVEVKGTGTVEIASGATFTINNRANKGAKVDSGNTLVLKGDGELAVVAGLIVGGTLDLSAAAVPTINGNVTLNVDSTIVLPAGATLPFTVCDGTLTAGAVVYVKIGDADPAQKTLTVADGTITAMADPVFIYYSDYPTEVPMGVTYTYVGGASAAEAVTISDSLNVKGTLKTQGFLNIANYYAGSNYATLDVESGTTRLNCNDQAICGYLIVRDGATLVNKREADAIVYSSYATTVDVYGTLDMGNTRWTLWDRATINMHGGTITGAGQGSNGALDFMGTSSLNADENSEISASIKFRNALTSVTVAENKTLTLSGIIRGQYAGGGVTKKGAGNLTFTTAPNDIPAGIVHQDGHLVFNTGDYVTLTNTYNTAATANRSLWYATQSNWKGTVKVDSLSGNLSWLTGAGNANSTISLQNVNNAYVMANGNTAYSLPGTLRIDGPVEFNNGSSGSTVNITNLTGSSTLVLGGWSGCSSARYNLVNVDSDWTGTLVVSNGITRGSGGTFTIGIGNIESANTTPGACVLPITNVALEGVTGTVAYNIDNATLNGAEADLEVKADGIYVAEAEPSAPAAMIGETTYATVMEALNVAYGAGAPGTVVVVLDETFQWDALYNDYFRWDSNARTATRISNMGSADNVIADSAEAAIALVVGSVTRPAAVEAYVSAEAYAGYFTKTATQNGNGTWSVSSTLDREVVFSGEASETAMLQALLAGALDSNANTITLPAKNGLYYSIAAGTDLTVGLTEGTRALATGGSVTLTKPAGNFFKIHVNTTAD